MRPHKNRKDLSGKKFGRLTALALVDASGNAKWECVCDCGRELVVEANRLQTGNTKSCGCFLVDSRKSRMFLHGHTCKNSPEYRCWASMIQRCTNPNAKKYSYYGGRGITVCDAWRNSFLVFMSDMGPRPNGAEIDRTNNDLGYSKENCRWATRKEQCNNQSSNVLIAVDGETATLAQWSEKSGICRVTILNRIKRGWEPKAAVFTAPKPTGPKGKHRV